MDDILIATARNGKWDAEAVLHDFKENCYTKPLRLEGGTQGTFLETTFEVKNNEVEWWLKNANADGDTRVWRYQHFYSYGSYQQKRALLRACLTKVQSPEHGIGGKNTGEECCR